jgi:hypothetical protein
MLESLEWTMIGVGAGLMVTTLLGWGCNWFLNHSVTVRFPPDLEAFRGAEKGGGGKQLGVLERVLFFGSLWLGRYEIAAGWLAFKLGAKWATWQHITRMPEKIVPNDIAKDIEIRTIVSSRVLGRFLNGTLYNILCAAIGWIIGTVAYRIALRLSADTLPVAAACTGIGALALLIWSGWPDHPDKDAARP